MRIVAFETSSSSGAVAVLENDQPIAAASLSRSQRTAKWLIPVTLELLEQTGCRPMDSRGSEPEHPDDAPS